MFLTATRGALALALCSLLGTAVAQNAPPTALPTIRTAPAAPMVLPTPLPLSEQPRAEQWTAMSNGERVVRNVKAAWLVPVRPAASRANGRAVLVVPGGAYNFVAIENEGLPVAQRLAEAGYAAFVLVYRTKPTPVDEPAYAEHVMKEIGAIFSRPRTIEDDLLPFGPAVDDALAAMRYLRERAADWGFVPAKLGYLGFSAGARTGRALVERAEPAEMPASLGLIYGGFARTTPRTPVPPLFLAQAGDDRLFPWGNFNIVQDWAKAGQRVELHLYEQGGHGFGAQRKGTTSDGWMESYISWLDTQR